MTRKPVLRGEVWWADLPAPRGSEAGYPRPVLVVQRDRINESAADTVLVTPFTTNLRRKELPGNVHVGTRGTGLPQPSVAVGIHTFAIPREDLSRRLGRVSADTQSKVDAALGYVLGLQQSPEVSHGS